MVHKIMVVHDPGVLAGILHRLRHNLDADHLFRAVSQIQPDRPDPAVEIPDGLFSGEPGARSGRVVERFHLGGVYLIERLRGNNKVYISDFICQIRRAVQRNKFLSYDHVVPLGLH